MLVRITETLELVKSASADDADCRGFVIHIPVGQGCRLAVCDLQAGSLRYHRLMSVCRFFSLFLLSLILASCSTPSPPPAPGTDSAGSYSQPPQDRPSLGTRWGETRKSLVDTTNFVRATPGKPLATAPIFYNDRAGIEAMAAASQPQRVW